MRQLFVPSAAVFQLGFAFVLVLLLGAAFNLGGLIEGNRIHLSVLIEGVAARFCLELVPRSRGTAISPFTKFIRSEANFGGLRRLGRTTDVSADVHDPTTVSFGPNFVVYLSESNVVADFCGTALEPLLHHSVFERK